MKEGRRDFTQEGKNEGKKPRNPPEKSPGVGETVGDFVVIGGQVPPLQLTAKSSL